MTRYRSKPVFVDAFQWNTGDVIEGVTPHSARIRYSDDRKLFYIEKNMVHPTFWLSTDKQAGEATEAQKKEGGFLSPATAQYRVDAEVYCRTMLYFSTWKVPARQHINEPIDEADPLFLDYASSSRWDASILGPATTAYIARPGDSGGRICFKSGDWVITDDKGLKRTMTDDAFRAEFERFEGGFITEDEVTP